MSDRDHRGWSAGVCGLGLIALALAGAPARAEFVFSVYGGAAFTDDADLKIKAPGGTNLTVHDGSYNDKSFEMPPYYGLRLTYWCDKSPEWGACFDYTHAKVYLDTSDTANITGTLGGAPVASPAVINGTVQRFNMSHGLNFFMFNLMHRWFLTPQRDDSLLGRIQPYLGVGGGFTVPHVEATIGTYKTDDYLFGGGAFQAMAGLNFDIAEQWALFVEYKFTYADVDVDLKGGGSAQIEPLTHHLVFGVSFRF